MVRDYIASNTCFPYETLKQGSFPALKQQTNIAACTARYKLICKTLGILQSLVLI